MDRPHTWGGKGKTDVQDYSNAIDEPRRSQIAMPLHQIVYKDKITKYKLLVNWSHRVRNCFVSTYFIGVVLYFSQNIATHKNQLTAKKDAIKDNLWAVIKAQIGLSACLFSSLILKIYVRALSFHRLNFLTTIFSKSISKNVKHQLQSNSGQQFIF